MDVPLIDLSRQHAELRGELAQSIESVLESGQFVLGGTVEAFERDLAHWCGAAEAVGVSSGTDALLVALMALDIGSGHEVITSPFTFFSTASSILRVGARPIFVDIDPDNFNLQPQSIEASIGNATKAILPVHLYGLPAPMEPIRRTAQNHGLRVIEDAAQAIGARYDGSVVGAIGDVGCLSFYPTKNLAAIGDAGACITNDSTLAERIRRLRVHGSGGTDYHEMIGGNFRIDALHASVLRVKLRCLEKWIEHRRTHAEAYRQGLEDLPLATPHERSGQRHVYNCFTIRVHDGRRDALQKHLKDSGIGSRVYYPVPLHLQPSLGELGYRRGDLPNAEEAAAEVLSLPIFPELTTEQRDHVIESIRGFYVNGC